MNRVIDAYRKISINNLKLIVPKALYIKKFNFVFFQVKKKQV
jgi:hypothetical protein